MSKTKTLKKISDERTGGSVGTVYAVGLQCSQIPYWW